VELIERTIVQSALNDPVSTVRALTKKSLFFFIQYFWPEYSQQPFSPNWHIEYICTELEKVARAVANNEPREYDLIINVPPGTTKTAMVSIFFNVWCWVNWHWMRFICSSYTQPLSLESAEYCREIIRSERFKETFPEFDIKEDKDTKSNFRVVKKEWVNSGFVPRLNLGGNRFSTSVGGTVTGFHGHILVVDDPIDPQRVLSETEVKKANHWMDNTLPFRKVDKRVTVTILVMQRLHQDDPTGHWLKLKGAKIKHICLPGEIKNYLSNVKPAELAANYVDELLDVNRLDWNALNEILNRGQYVYGGQVGQDPVPLGGGMFKVDRISVRSHLPSPNEIVSIVRYWDKAGTEGGTGAYTAGVKMSKLKNGKFLVENIKRGRWAAEERESIIKHCAEADEDKCRIGIEQEPGSGGKESAEATVKNLAGFSAKPDRPTGNKVYRADPFSVQVNNGNVEIMAGEWNTDYLDELKNFPNSTYKDMTDASSGAFAMLTKLKQAGVIRKSASTASVNNSGK
jgi:predicted phage terminase large subunit-like protein